MGPAEVWNARGKYRIYLINGPGKNFTMKEHFCSYSIFQVPERFTNFLPRKKQIIQIKLNRGKNPSWLLNFTNIAETTVNKSSYSVVVRAGPKLKNSSELQVQAL